MVSALALLTGTVLGVALDQPARAEIVLSLPEFADTRVFDNSTLLRTMSDEDYADGVLKLTPFARWVALEGGTELPNKGQTFVNGYRWDTNEPGTYASAISGVAVFSSSAKYDSGTGWASFWAPIDASRIFERPDPSDKLKKPTQPNLWRTQVLDRASMTHLGHVFRDPSSPSKKRYRVNAAVMKFYPGEVPPMSVEQALQR